MTIRQRTIGSPKIRSAYAFLVEAERTSHIFNLTELIVASGWTEKTTRANLSKKLNQVVERTDGGYRCIGAVELGEDGFCRVCSQNSALAGDPRRPTLSQKTEELVIKARESALAAVQHYNNPNAHFRSGNYLVLMVIGFTALFHAIFERDGVDYIERKTDGSPRPTKDGEPYHWDALRSARAYAQLRAGRYEGQFLAAAEKNIEFILPIRNKIEHRHMPQLDVEIGGHCQSLLLNFERILSVEFGNYYALNPSLNLALQFSTERRPETAQAVRRLQSAEYQALRDYVARFHANLPDEIAGDKAFELRVWMVQKPANRERNSDLSLEFVPRDQLSDERYAELQQAIVALKATPEDLSKTCNLWESEVLSQVVARIGAEVQFGDRQCRLTNTMIREVRDAHGITSPSRLYYRPARADSRAMYSPAFVDWIIEQHTTDPNFFFNARQIIRAADWKHR